ncbi:hypothetical protein C9374_003781 [Naegleria lovaniensis]|uniref:Ras guanine nucleotide exchange factor glfB-like C-terminal domain-containing protein n=1 Tax=Naegleria lovaniensis TaxID=51637 RepID=A0AA88H8D6_NAELO|nr:uncharacterized protein C9374_003781 [Naegleria lovaniensis]KAG2394017.1 hypothetical protein C9374_003781 [Naegleria lovaniensis]
MSSRPQEEVFVDQSLEELLAIVATEFDAISRKPIQSSFLARDLVRMYDKITFYRQKDFELSPMTVSQQENDNIHHHDENVITNNDHGNKPSSSESELQVVEQLPTFSSNENSESHPPSQCTRVDTNRDNDTSHSTNHSTCNTTNHSTCNTTTATTNTTTMTTTHTSKSTHCTNHTIDDGSIITVLSSSTTTTTTERPIDHERITQFVYQQVEHNEFEKFSHLSRNLNEMEKEDRGDQIFVDILNTLTRLFHQKESIQECKPLLTLQEFKKIVVSKSVPNYVSTLMEGHYGDGHPIVKFLTLVDQAFVVSLLGHFAESLFFTKIPIRFKDIRGTWRIDIRMYPNYISMVHRRTEQMMKPLGNTMLKNLFQFSWQVEIVYDSYQLDHIHSIHVTLLEIDWSSYDESLELTSQQKDEVQQVFLKMFSKSKTGGELGYQLPLKITLSDISPKHLRLLVKELKENAKKLVKPNNDSNGSSSGGSWFSGIFSSLGCMDDAVDFVSNSKRKD